MGAPAKKIEAFKVLKAVPGVNIYLGGKIGEHPFLALEPYIKGIPLTEEDLIPILTKIIAYDWGRRTR